MDVAGTAVGIASLGIQVCQGLLSYYDSWKAHDSDISSTYNAITDLSRTLTLLRTVLQRETDKETVGRVRSCVNDCEVAVLELEKKRSSLQEYGHPEGLRQKMRAGLQRTWYPFRKETLEKLKASVTDVQERLKLALQVLQLDMGTESQKLVLRLLSQTTTQGDSIAQIAAQNQRILDVQQSDEFRKIVAWLAPPDPETNHATARQRHQNQTGDWLLKSSQYQKWKTGAVNHLWMYGKAGCGKTILCSTAIEDIRNTCRQDPDISCASFYFSFSDERKQSDGDLLRSLVAQLGWMEPGLSMLRQAYKNPRQSIPGPDELENILSASIRSCSRVYLLLDALDECPEDNDARQGVLQRLERLTQDTSNLKIFATSRELDRLRRSMEALAAEPLPVVTRAVDVDIQVYLSSQLSRDPNLRELSSKMRTLIEDTIASQADGMFRWAYCQLQELRTLDSHKPKYVKEVLRSLPPTLDDTYTRMLTRIKKMYHPEALTLLRWLAYARSPPTLAELVDAAIIDPDEESSIDTDERGGLRDALNILSGLVITEEEQPDAGGNDSDTGSLTSDSDTASFTSNVSSHGPEQGRAMFHSENLTPDTRVRLAHFSVKEYLESKRVLDSDACQFYLKSTTGHRALAQSCLMYLRYYSLSREKTMTPQDLEKFPLLQYSARSWYYHSTLQCNGEVSREMSLLDPGQIEDDWLRVYDPDFPRAEPFPKDKYDDKGRWAGAAIYYASLLGLLAVVDKLLDCGANIEAQGGKFGTALHAASARGDKEIVQLLLDKGAKIDAVSGAEGGTALQTASAYGYKEIVQLLLDKGPNIDAVGGYYGTALRNASAGGDKEIVQLLLDKGAKIDAVSGAEGGTALQIASAYGYKEIVQLLLDRGADVDIQDGRYNSTALETASANGDKDIVKLLIDKGANVDIEGGPYGTALHTALAAGHKEIVQLLLDKGANVDIGCGQYKGAGVDIRNIRIASNLELISIQRHHLRQRRLQERLILETSRKGAADVCNAKR